MIEIQIENKGREIELRKKESYYEFGRESVCVRNK